MNAPADWWQNFFSGVALDLWRQAITEDQTREEADFIQAMLDLQPASKILDVPCGNGRLSLELAARGFRVTGMDLAREFVEEARAKASGRGLDGEWEQGDMRALGWQTEFDGAFCSGNSFGYFEDAENEKFPNGVSRALKPRARFALAANCAECILPRFQERTSEQVGDILFVEENHYDLVSGRIDTEYTFVREGKSEKRIASQRIYTYREICRLLEEAGFEDTQGFGSVNKDPFNRGSPLLFLVTTKRRP